MARSSISASKILDAPYSLLFPSLFTNPPIQIKKIQTRDKKFPFFINNPLIYNFTTIISIVNKTERDFDSKTLKSGDNTSSPRESLCRNIEGSAKKRRGFKNFTHLEKSIALIKVKFNLTLSRINVYREQLRSTCFTIRVWLDFSVLEGAHSEGTIEL